MALALQTGGLHRDDWKRWLVHVPGMLSLPAEDVEDIFRHLVEAKIFRDDHGLLWFDETGEKTFGRRHFMELVSVFTSLPVLEVFHGRSSIATLDQLSFAVDNGAAIQRGRPTILTLAGRHWVVTEVDWKRRQVFVAPANDDGKSRWAGGSQDISRPFAESERAVLTGDLINPRWSKRAVDKLMELRQAYAWIGTDCVRGQIGTNLVELWTFAGTRMNRLLAAQMDPSAEKSSFTHRSVILKGSYSADEVAALWNQACDAVESGVRIVATEQQADAIKFSEAVPVALRRQSIAHRLDPQPRVIDRRLKLVTVGST